MGRKTLAKMRTNKMIRKNRTKTSKSAMTLSPLPETAKIKTHATETAETRKTPSTPETEVTTTKETRSGRKSTNLRTKKTLRN